MRIGNIGALTKRLARGDRWDMVFNFAEGTYGYGREAQIPALLDAHGIPYTFSDPLVCALTLHKGMAQHVARGCGVPTPPRGSTTWSPRSWPTLPAWRT